MGQEKYIGYCTKDSDKIYFNPIAKLVSNGIIQMESDDLDRIFKINRYKNYYLEGLDKDCDLDTENNSLIVYTDDLDKIRRKGSTFKYYSPYNDDNKHELYEENIFYAVSHDDYQAFPNKEYLEIKLEYIHPGNLVFLEKEPGHWYGPIRVTDKEAVERDTEQDSDGKNVITSVIVLQDIDKSTVKFDIKSDNKKDNDPLVRVRLVEIKDCREDPKQDKWNLFIPKDESEKIKRIANTIIVISGLEQKKEKLTDEVSELEQKKEKLTDEVSDLDDQNKNIEQKSNEIKNEFNAFLGSTGKRMADVTIDGFLSSKMSQAATKWENDESKQHRDLLMDYVKKLEVEKKESPVLIDDLCKAIQTVRPQYDRNTIINIAICITQGFLTVFSGEPGCGKTSICNYFGQALGLNSIYNKISKGKEDNGNKEDKEFVNRYTVVSVERGWTTKRDFIGYYNPLSKVFDKSNRKVYDALNQLDFEIEDSKLPYLILLDEANLSPMEYYWSDFITICDKLTDQNNDEQENGKEPIQVNLGGDFVFNIPETLRFVATINNDHTTETLSPRLIDRAWVITLPSHDEHETNNGVAKIQGNIDIISWNSLCEAFAPYLKAGNNEDCNTTIDQKDIAIYDEVCETLRKQRIVLSFRVKKAIERYLIVASKTLRPVDFEISNNKEGENETKNIENRSQNDNEKEIPVTVTLKYSGEKTGEEPIIRTFEINISESEFKKGTTEDSIAADIVAMDYAILQRILPKISGSGDSFGKWLKEFRNYLFINNMFMSAKKVDEIVKHGDSQLKYYQFFC